MILDRSYCTGNVGRERFQCYNDQHKCLSSHQLGTGTSQCSNNYDESWYRNGLRLLVDLLCGYSDTTGCQRVKEYIQ
jgi:hypothetical protein